MTQRNSPSPESTRTSEDSSPRTPVSPIHSTIHHVVSPAGERRSYQVHTAAPSSASRSSDDKRSEPDSVSADISVPRRDGGQQSSELLSDGGGDSVRQQDRGNSEAEVRRTEQSIYGEHVPPRSYGTLMEEFGLSPRRAPDVGYLGYSNLNSQYDDAPPPQYEPRRPAIDTSPTETTSLLASPSSSCPALRQESMGSPEHIDVERETFLYARIAKKTKRRRLMQKLLGYAVVVTGLLLFIGYAAKTSDAVKTIIGDDGALLGRRYKTMPNGNVEWAPGETCYPEVHRAPLYFFPVKYASNRNLTIIQDLEHTDDDNTYPSYRPSAFGDIRFIPATDRLRPGLYVESLSNSDTLKTAIQWHSDEQKLLVITPAPIHSWHHELSPCVQVRITVVAPANASLNTMDVASVILEMNVEKDFSLNADVIGFANVAGGFIAEEPEYESRSTTLKAKILGVSTVSGKIKAVLPRTNQVIVNSASGHVDLKLKHVVPVAESDRQSSLLKVKTLSGKIEVSDPVDDPLVATREYYSQVQSTSGHVVAKLLSTISYSNTISGSLSVFIQPVVHTGSEGCNSQLTTKTVSGHQQVRVAEPFYGEFPHGNAGLLQLFETGIVHGDNNGAKLESRAIREMASWLSPVNLLDAGSAVEPSSEVSTLSEAGLRCMKSAHSSMSGRLDISMPTSWSGRFEAKSMTGAITISGGETVIREEYRIAHAASSFKAVMGNKGDGLSSLVMSTMSGAIKADVGQSSD